MSRPEPRDGFDSYAEDSYQDRIEYTVNGETYTSAFTQEDLDCLKSDYEEDEWDSSRDEDYDDYDDYDGQPDEMTEWLDYDPDC